MEPDVTASDGTGQKAGKTRVWEHGATTWVALVVLVLTPLLVLGASAVIAAQPNFAQTAAEVEPMIVEPTQQETGFSAPRTIEIEYSAGFEARTEASGLVTRAPQQAVVLQPGDDVLSVDGMAVKAFVADQPLYRPLTTGDRGEDVRAIQQFLTSIGYDTGGADGVFGSGVRSAVVRFNSDIGRGATGTFDPASVVWIGPEPLEVVTVAVAAGDRVSPGVSVIAGPMAPQAVLVTNPSEDTAGTSAEPADGLQLVAGDIAVPYSPGSVRIDEPEAVAAIVAAIAPATTGSATVRSIESSEVMVVPASALVQGVDGTLCIYESAEATPTEVVPLGGGLASVQLAPDTPLDRVLVNPGSVAVTTSCGS